MTGYSVAAVQRRCRTVSSIPAVFAAEGEMPTLGEVERAYGYDFLHAYVESWIVNLREFVNVGRGMTDAQTYETATLLLSIYPYLTLADIHLLFRRAKTGYYGKLYDRLDGQVILDWFRRYDTERAACAEEASMQEAERFKGDSPPRTSERTLAEVAELRKREMRRLYEQKAGKRGVES